MIHIEFDDERNVPEETVEAAAQRARQWDARMRRLSGLRSRQVAATAASTAGMIGGSSRKLSRIRGRFAEAVIDPTPMKADYRAALSVSGGIQPRHLPWLACERAIQGEYDVVCKRVDFELELAFKIPPAKVTLSLGACDDDSIDPGVGEATLSVGVASAPLPLHLPSGMGPNDLAAALNLIMPQIEKAAFDLWLQSDGGLREVF